MILPIKFIIDEDGPLVGKDLVNLAKLYRHGFPIADGLAVCPPEFRLKTILKHFEFKDKEVFEQQLNYIKRDVFNIECPVELEEALAKKNIDARKLWINLLQLWIGEIRSRIWSEGFFKGLTNNLSCQPVFFTGQIIASGDIFYDYENKQPVIKVPAGRLTAQQVLKLEELTKKANKKLFLPQIYQFIVDSSIKFVKVTPFTQYPIIRQEPAWSESKADIKEDRQVGNSAIRVFLQISDELRLEKNIDGVIICAEPNDWERKVFQLVEVASSLANKPVIYKLPDKLYLKGDVRGSLRLIFDSNLLKTEVEAFLFARNKKKLLNTQIAIPFVRSSQEFAQIKRDLACLGVHRKGSLKLWLELAVPENIFNLEDYLVAGFDGAIINLDELASLLGGFEQDSQQAVFYSKQIAALVKFLQPGLKMLHKSSIPVIVTGKLALHDDLLRLLIDKGIWGISVDLASSVGFDEHLKFIERNNLRARLIS